MDRRTFVATVSQAAALTVIGGPLLAGQPEFPPAAPRRLVMIGTSNRGITMWGRDLLALYPGIIQFVGLSDINPGRVEYAKAFMGTACPIFTDADEMLDATKPDTVLVMTVDAFHDTYIVKALERGLNVISEKPLTTDETKLQRILDAERTSGKKVLVTFNYRYSPHRMKIKELLAAERVGKITSVDFHWYLDVYHGADYFRRWHRRREFGGSLLVHKATHHFDLLNWWLDSDPALVHALGSLEFYGKNNAYRHTHCRPCPHSQCQFRYDMTKNEHFMKLYAANEKYDGYYRDGCVWREDVDIFDKMAVQIRYANNVQVSYSLTTYSPYEGYRIAFNGTNGRIEAWIKERQPWAVEPFDEIRVTDNFGKTEVIQIPEGEGGHGGGDNRMRDFIFKDPSAPDPLGCSAGSRDGAMSVLVGFAARRSIDTGAVVRIADLTDLVPHPRRGRG